MGNPINPHHIKTDNPYKAAQIRSLEAADGGRGGKAPITLTMRSVMAKPKTPSLKATKREIPYCCSSVSCIVCILASISGDDHSLWYAAPGGKHPGNSKGIDKENG